jgi:hypothetical protein
VLRAHGYEPVHRRSHPQGPALWQQARVQDQSRPPPVVLPDVLPPKSARATRVVSAVDARRELSDPDDVFGTFTPGNLGGFNLYGTSVSSFYSAAFAELGTRQPLLWVSATR